MKPTATDKHRILSGGRKFVLDLSGIPRTLVHDLSDRKLLAIRKIHDLRVARQFLPASAPPPAQQQPIKSLQKATQRGESYVQETCPDRAAPGWRPIRKPHGHRGLTCRLRPVSRPTDRMATTHPAASGVVYGLGILRSADPACCQNLLQVFRPINHRA